MVVVAAVWDIRRGMLPNWLTYGATLVAIVVNGLIAEAWWFGLAGASVAFGIWFVLFATGGVGGGDVKLMTAVGAVWGVYGALAVSLYAICFGFVMALLWALFQGRLWEMAGRGFRTVLVVMMSRSLKDQVDESDPAVFPFAVAIALAVCAFAIEQMLDVRLLPFEEGF